MSPLDVICVQGEANNGALTPSSSRGPATESSLLHKVQSMLPARGTSVSQHGPCPADAGPCSHRCYLQSTPITLILVLCVTYVGKDVSGSGRNENKSQPNVSIIEFCFPVFSDTCKAAKSVRYCQETGRKKLHRFLVSCERCKL